MLVPLMRWYPPPGFADQISTPGPLVSILSPLDENDARVRFGFNAATFSKFCDRPGQSVSGVLGPLFPPAKISQIPASAHSLNRFSHAAD